MGWLSQTITIGPAMRRKSCLRNRSTCSPHKFTRKDLIDNLIFLPCGLTKRAPSKFSRRWWSRLVYVQGVCPRGPQLLCSGETSEKPLSSSKTSQAFSSQRFFYTRQLMHLPILDHCFISLDRQTLHALVAPPHAGEQSPDPAGHITYLEQLPDDMTDPIQCPIIFCIPMSVCSFQQFPFQLFDLLLRQVCFFPWSPLTLSLRMFRFLSPTADAAFGGSQLSGDFWDRFTTFQQIQCFLASFRKLFRGARWSHAPIILQSAYPGHFYVKIQ